MISLSITPTLASSPLLEPALLISCAVPPPRPRESQILSHTFTTHSLVGEGIVLHSVSNTPARVSQALLHLWFLRCVRFTILFLQRRYPGYPTMVLHSADDISAMATATLFFDATFGGLFYLPVSTACAKPFPSTRLCANVIRRSFGLSPHRFPRGLFQMERFLHECLPAPKR